MARVQQQPHVIHLPATSSLESVRSALSQLESCEALLVFSADGVPTLVRPQALAALRAFCGEQEIEAVFIGGDAELRAMAVAEGFAAATSIDAWEAHVVWQASLVAPPSHQEWTAADVALVASGGGQQGGDDGASWHADPPTYVLRLLGGVGGFAGPRDEPTPQEAERLREEVAATDPLLRALHDYEERMTTTIRDTGRLPAWQPSGR